MVPTVYNASTSWISREGDIVNTIIVRTTYVVVFVCTIPLVWELVLWFKKELHDKRTRGRTINLYAIVVNPPPSARRRIPKE